MQVLFNVQARLAQHVFPLVSPLYESSYVAYDSLGYVRNFLRSQQHLLNENLKLQEELKLLRMETKIATNLQQENDHLLALLNALPTSQREYSVATVTGLQIATLGQQLLLRPNTNKTLGLGSPVVDENGLVGQIIEHSNLLYNVALVSNLKHNTAVKVARTGERFVAKGTGTLNFLEINHAPRGSDLQEGDLIVTSGLGGDYPENIPVGKIISIDRKSSFAVAKIKTLVDLRNVSKLVLVRCK